jgi:ADP-ribosylglycohydrolase
MLRNAELSAAHTHNHPEGIKGAIAVALAFYDIRHLPNTTGQDVKKKLMMVVGACIFLIAAAQALPLFFGIS